MIWLLKLLPFAGGLLDKHLARKDAAAARRLYQKENAHKIVQESEARMAEKQAAMIKDDRASWTTSWIRPVFALATLIFWVLLAGSQMVYVPDSQQLIPLIFHVPPSTLGQFFLALPFGIIMTFTLGRPFEKRAMMRYFQ